MEEGGSTRWKYEGEVRKEGRREKVRGCEERERRKERCVVCDCGCARNEMRDEGSIGGRQRGKTFKTFKTQRIE